MSHGYWKDLLNILALATVGELTASRSTFLHSERKPYTYPRSRKGPAKTGSPAERIKAAVRRAQVEKTQAKEKRALANAQRHKILLRRLAQPKYRALYVAVARLFADRLAEDLRVLAKLDTLSPGPDRQSLFFLISLANKWAPTPQGAHDRHTNIATAIVQVLQHHDTPLIYPSALGNGLAPLEEAVILRSFYQRWVLTALRKATSLPEPLMSAKRWKEIKYNRVASVCMKNNVERFYQHDPDGFQAYLISVEKGKKSISGATLFPHELVAQAMALEPENDNKYPALVEFRKGIAETRRRVVEAQWKTLIESLRESGRIENALAVCDVSGSMGSLEYGSRLGKGKDVQPILPAIALSLVLASLAKPPFNGGFVTFSSRPEYVQLDLTQSLRDIVLGMSQAHWENNTDLNAVFTKLLLPLAVKHQVPKEDMIKRLFVFTDMQFDEDEGTRVDAASWETNHDVIERAYKDAGYEMPEIVYWDLNASGQGTVEVHAERRGVAMMNGFSGAMLKVFMGESEEQWESVGEDGETVTVVGEEFNPVNVMRRAVMKMSFDGLVVVD
jgi:cation transport regulator ChaB